MLGTLVAFVLQTDPYLLDVNGRGTVRAEVGLLTSAEGRTVTPTDVAVAARGHRFVFVGESHDQLEHHKMQAAVIEALVADGRDVAVGFEMFTRDNQPNLAPWTTGRWTREEFIEKSNWKSQWGLDFALYGPVFQAVRKHRLPMVALNIPRPWIQQVGRQGIASLTEEQREWIPDPSLRNEGHRAVIKALMQGHPMTEAQTENLYAAQVCWDEGMATSAVDYMEGRFSRSAVMVIVAGSGHVMYGLGINYRVWRKTGDRGLSVVCLTSPTALTVSRGLADFVFVAPTP